MAHRFDFENCIHDDGRSNRKALQSTNQSRVAGLPAKDLDEEIRGSLRHKRMLGKLLRRRHQDR